ncbi:MAG: ABC transporter substrate-binding protein [Methanomassiliicoccaceae archaeon]|nr:ABC transporter substrate-binding protein [Methanomassiliicoccaceae archaeon]
MEKIKIIAFIAVVAVVVAGSAIFVISNDNGGKNNKSGTVTVTDYLGREVTITSAERIVSAGSTPTAILCGLGLSSNIVAASSDMTAYSVDSFVFGLTQDDFPKVITDGFESGKIKALGPGYQMSAETMVSVDCDLIISDNYGKNQDTWDALNALGVTYIVIPSSNTVVEGIYDKIEIVGKAVSRESEAERIISQMKNVINKISDWCESIVENELSGQKYNVALMMTATIAIGWNYPQGSVLNALHVNNVFESVGTYATVSKESIANADPDVLIYQTLGMGDGVTDPVAYVKSLYSDPVIGKTKAAENGLIFTTIDGAKAVAGQANQDFVNAYALYAMFIYKDYLTFEIPDALDDDYAAYTQQFWEMVSS